ncbi:MAG: hypothetical protein JWM16_3067 [Verrucomicrobiales bacterium]|nr:hypothetical protein [Verrucomicrobiales bacterium]
MARKPHQRSPSVSVENFSTGAAKAKEPRQGLSLRISCSEPVPSAVLCRRVVHFCEDSLESAGCHSFSPSKRGGQDEGSNCSFRGSFWLRLCRAKPLCSNGSMLQPTACRIARTPANAIVLFGCTFAALLASLRFKKYGPNAGECLRLP